MKRILIAMLAMMLCAAGALAAGPGKITGPEGGAEYDGSKARVFITKPGTYTIEDWITEARGGQRIEIDGDVEGEVALNLRNVHLNTNRDAVRWYRSPYSSGEGSRTLRLVFENSEIATENASYCVYMLDVKDADNTLIIEGEAPKLTSSGNDCISIVLGGGDTARVEIAADNAQIVAAGSANYADAFHMNAVGGMTEISVTGKNVQITGAYSAFRIDGDAAISLTGSGAQIAGRYAASIWGNSKSELILGADVTLSATRQMVERGGNVPVDVKVDGKTYPGICVMAANNAQGDNSNLIGEYEAMTTIEDKPYRYLHTVCVPRPEQPAAPDELPETGDTQDVTLYAALLALAATGAVLLRKRKEA